MIWMETLYGYFGEDKISDLFTIDKYRFHIYDLDKNEYGHTDEVKLSLLYQNEIKDNSGNVVYKIEKNFTVFTDEYTITKKKDSNITMDRAILLTCIIDAIMDSEKD